MMSVQEHLADQMTRAQAMRLRRLSHEAYQPRQFEENLTKAEASEKIEQLQATTDALRRIEALEKEIELADSF